MVSGSVKLGGIYRHYKGDVYEVTGFAKRESDQEVLILYKLHGAGLVEAPEVPWARPVGEFLEKFQPITG